jgi:hypothetical protein
LDELEGIVRLRRYVDADDLETRTIIADTCAACAAEKIQQSWFAHSVATRF